MVGDGSETWWKALLARDRHFDGIFIYGVRSTGIYCRPSCPARRPRRDQVLFFQSPDAAAASGFRPCRRCRPDETPDPEGPTGWVRRLCRHLEEHDFSEGPPTLAAMAEFAGLSPHHLQRTFKRFMGISPRQYAEACRLRRLKIGLKAGENVTHALYEAGYGSSSRLYEGAAGHLGMTPRSYGRGGKGMLIRYTIVDSPLGRLLLAATEKGISAVSIGKRDPALERALYDEYPAADIRRDTAGLAGSVRALLDSLEVERPHPELPLDVQVTAFQRRVYEALRAIPAGRTRSYAEIAEAIGQPGAVRAVARACASNPVALLIPCHRVIRKDGRTGGYRWGAPAKQALLAMEKAGTSP
jgi:AraC family transcriptional regulator of adaptative response/methylated-DNA-[protein]-cysteine methyltransferase